MTAMGGFSGFDLASFAVTGTGGIGGTWTVSTNDTSLLLNYALSSTNVWTNGSGNLSAINMTNGSTLVFAGTVSGTVTNNANGDATITSLAGISFSNSLTGTYTLAGTNAITINGGGVIENNSSKSQTIALPIITAGNLTITAASGTLTVSGNIDNTANGNVTFAGDKNSTFSGTLTDSGAGTMTKSGNGTLTLSGTNTSSQTYVNGGRVNLSGAINTAYIGVGDPGSGALLNINSGGHAMVSGYGLAVGNLDQPSGNKVWVNGSNSTLTVTGGVYVGNTNNAVGNTLELANRGVASVDNVFVGYGNGANGNFISVRDAGSILNAGTMAIGVGANSGNYISVYSNGVINSLDVTLGANDGNGGASSGNSAVVTTNGIWNITGALTIGDGSSSNSLTVSGAGTVSVSGDTRIGTASTTTVTTTDPDTSIITSNSVTPAPGQNNVVIVSGAGSVLRSAGAITIGDTGSGTLTVGSGGSVIVNGSTNSAIFLANSANASGTLNLGTFGGNDTNVSVITPSIRFGTNGGTAVLNFNQADTLTFASVVSGNGSLVQNGSGTTILTKLLGQTGATVVNAGTLQYGDGSTNGSGLVTTTGGNGTITDNGKVAFAQYNALTNGSVITGRGSVAQIGYGTTILTGANDYQGTTLISNGFLQVGNGGTTGSLGSGSITLANSATLIFNRSDALTFGNSIGGIGNVTYLGGSYTNGAVSTYNGFTTIDGANVTLGSINSGGNGRIQVGMTQNGGQLKFTGSAVTSVDSMQVGGSNTSSGNGVMVTGATVNLTHTLGIGAQANSGNNLHITYGGSVTSGNLYVGLGYSNAPAVYGNNSLEVTGTGASLTANGGSVGNFVGNASSDNFLNVTAGASLKSVGNFYIGWNGGTNNSVTVTGSGSTWSNSQFINVDGGALNLGSNAVVTSASVNLASSNAQLNFNQAGSTNVLNAGITGTAGSVNVDGGGTTILTGTGSYSGATRVAAGSTLQFGNGLSSGTIGSTSIQNSGFVKFNNAGTTTFSGQISGGSLGQSGGTTILTGNNSISGTTTIATNSTLQVGNGGNSGALGDGNVVNDGSLLFNRVDALTQSGAISGLGSVTKNGSGALSLLGDNSYIGSTAVNAGSLNLGTTGKLSGTSGVTVANGATLLLGSANQVNTAADLTLGGTLNMGAGSSKASQAFNSLTLTANSIIDFSALSGVSQLSFGSINLGGKTLSVYNWNGGSSWYPSIGVSGNYTSLYDLAGSSDLTTKDLSNISFYSGGVGNGTFLGTGQFAGNQIVPVPEPGVVLAALMLLGCLLFGNRRTLALLIPVRR